MYQFLLCRFCKSLTDPGEYYTYIIPVIHQRLTSHEGVEPTEEIRLLLVNSLGILIDLNGQKASTFVDEYMQVLQKTLVDSFADVRKVHYIKILRI